MWLEKPVDTVFEGKSAKLILETFSVFSVHEGFFQNG